MQTALAMTGITVDLETAEAIQNVMHKLIEKGLDYNLDDACEIRHNIEKKIDAETRSANSEEIKELNIRYSTLSAIYNPKSSSAFHRDIGQKMSKIMTRLTELKQGGDNGTS